MPVSPTQPSGPALSLIFGIAATVTLVLGVLAYKRYAESEQWVAQGIAQMQRAGEHLDDEGCVDAVLEWHRGCREAGGNLAVCLQGVKLAMYHCLAARARDRECTAYTDVQLDAAGRQDLGDWVYLKCSMRGNACKIPRECACADAYRSLQSFCKTGQRAVQL